LSGTTGTDPRNWVLFTSSTGETFREVWSRLPAAARSQLKAIFSDRPSAAEIVARQVAPEIPYYRLTKADFERTVLEWAERQESKNSLVLLCGYFGILTEDFLTRLPYPVVNTHPSLLPAFPGLEKKVHDLAAETVAISGFTIHLVTPELDGGPILFQQPVWLDPRKTPEELRLDVRAAEQKWLPIVWDFLLRTNLEKDDLKLSSRSLRAKLGIVSAGFEERYSQ
jgi:phosphoribosylglycinamide formyltransferase 1